METLNRLVIDWFAENKRQLPWRSSSPWGVLVSEIMLQQTPVTRVLPVWNEWMRRWPTPHDLASASRAEVLTRWGRLGYPRRALRLHECSKFIVEKFNGEVPSDLSDLRSLPGIGEYTAAAIASFAFGRDALVLDVNIRRLFARHQDGIEFPRSSITQSERAERSQLMPRKKAHLWAAATMELGALICTAKNPRCGHCPIAATCRWRSLDYPKSDQPKRVQSWHGTDRQCRGVIVQALRENANLTRREITLLWDVPSQVEKAITTLLDDGLIESPKKNLYRLPAN